MSEIVKCEGLSKVFSGCRALDQVNLTIGRGKVIGLLGPEAPDCPQRWSLDRHQRDIPDFHVHSG